MNPRKIGTFGTLKKDMDIKNKMTAQNASRLCKALLDHIISNNDIERLATALDYNDAAQLEFDVEDFVTELSDMLKVKIQS